MPETPAQVEPPAAPKRVGQIQTDTFCEGCGYNLYTQAVTRDERLGLLVCRCPECGWHAVPGKATDAGRAWQQRLGTMLLVIFILFLLYVFGMAVAGLSAFHYEHLEDLSRPPTELSQRVSGHYIYHRGRTFDSAWQPLALSAGIAYCLGSFFAIFFCHWRRPAVWLATLVPVVLGIIVHAVWRYTSDDLTAIGQLGGPRVTAEHIAVQIAGLVLALLIARPVTRGFLRLMLARQWLPYFSAFWLADGLEPPAAKVATPSSA